MTSGTVLDSIYGRCRDTGSSVHESFLIICCGGSSAAMPVPCGGGDISCHRGFAISICRGVLTTV